MKKQKKQNLLTAIIIILVIALAMLVGSIVYEEVINMNKQQAQNTSGPIDKNEKEKISVEKEEEEEKEEIEEKKEEEQVDTYITTEDKQEFVGEEESNKEKEPVQSKDEKVIDLVKKEWGQDDSVTFNIEKKNGSKYRVAVRDNSTTVLGWYEVDTETWEVSEY